MSSDQNALELGISLFHQLTYFKFSNASVVAYSCWCSQLMHSPKLLLTMPNKLSLPPPPLQLRHLPGRKQQRDLCRKDQMVSATLKYVVSNAHCDCHAGFLQIPTIITANKSVFQMEQSLIIRPHCQQLHHSLQECLGMLRWQLVLTACVQHIPRKAGDHTCTIFLSYRERVTPLSIKSFLGNLSTGLKEIGSVFTKLFM